MRIRRLFTSLALLLGLASCAAAQLVGTDSQGPLLGETVVEKWRIGVIVTAGSGPCRGIVATTSVPTDWPEQQVRIVDEAISPGVRVAYRSIGVSPGYGTAEGAVKQMTVRVLSLAPGEQAEAVVTFEVKRSRQPAPDNTEVYLLANPNKLDRKLRPFLASSPYIESTHPQIKALAAKIGVDEAKAWDRVEAIYDWVRQTIEFQDDRGRAVKTTLETLRDGTGDCDELTSLFIAICRAGGIPARTVRLPGHCYPEFYLQDDQGRGHWFPCQAAGTRAFGEMPDPRPVLQKGDHLRLRDPQTKRMRSYRFLPDKVSIADARGTPPQVQFVLERVGE